MATLRLTSSTELAASFVWGNDLSRSEQGAGGVGGLLFARFYPANNYSGLPPTLVYYGYDGNGNVTTLYNPASQSVAAVYEYDAFGQILRQTGPTAATNPFRFSTKFTDDESGLNYYGYRYYSAWMGRWTSRDPIGESGGLNIYNACNGDCINVIDRLGREPVYVNQIPAVDENYTWEADRPAPRGNDNDTTPDGRAKFESRMEISATGCVLIVDIPINFVPGARPPLHGVVRKNSQYAAATEQQINAVQDKFQEGVNAKWNNKFQICCGSITATSAAGKAYTFTDQKHCCCKIQINLVRRKDGVPVGVFKLKGTNYSDQYNWNIDPMDPAAYTPGNVAGHESGHYLGNIDEYNNPRKPTSNNRPYGPTNPDGTRPNLDGSPNIMTDHREGTLPRHYWRILEAVNRDGQVKDCHLKPL